MKPNTIKMMKTRKNKIKEKYSRKRGGSELGSGGLPVPPGPPPVGSESEEALKIAEESKKVLEEAAKKKAESKSSGSGLNENLKVVQRELFTKLNQLNEEQLANLTIPMIKAVKQISSKPPELEVESGPKKMTTIYDEIDRFLVSLNKTKLYGSQIYYIDRLLQYYNSTVGIFKPTPKDKLHALDDDKFISLRDLVNTTKNLSDTTDMFKKQLIKMLADIDKYRKEVVSNVSDLRPAGRFTTLPSMPKISFSPFSKPKVSTTVPPTDPAIDPAIDPDTVPPIDPATGSSSGSSTGPP